MPTRSPEFPNTFERSLLQKIRSGQKIWLEEPGVRPNLMKLISKGWAEEVSETVPISYRITPAGEAAMRAQIPSRR